MLKIQPEKYQSFLSNGKFDGDGEKAFKNYLQEVVLDIVEKYGDKI
ncbi:MAG: hypothetical protein LBI53_05065 [Candidatus Peribacteria bacterium]|jgi:hypothetical protein|nr:hypothetical protein [Candidatus Peribacteria bacterium]